MIVYYTEFVKYPLKGRILDIGCGNKKYPGAVGFDRVKLQEVDVTGDVNKKLPFKSGEFDYVLCNSVLEHVDSIVDVMSEIHRILKLGGKALIHVPHYKNPDAYADPTHVHFFSFNTMNSFEKKNQFGYYYKFHFKVRKRLKFASYGGIKRYLLWPIEFLANIFPNFWEHLFPAFNVHYELTKQ